MKSKIHILINSYLVVALFSFSCIAASGCTGDEREADPDNKPTELEESGLPIEAIHHLTKGDKIEYILPNGRQLLWLARADSGFAEQTTSSGIKAYVVEPDFDELKNSSVTTSTRKEISIYRFDIDGFRVERAEDLSATHSLPVLIRIARANVLESLDHAVVRKIFDEQTNAVAGVPPRVPIGTVRKALREKFSFPIRIIMINNNLQLDISGDLHAEPELVRESTLREIMNHVIERWEQIDSADQFALVVMKNQQAAFKYNAEKDENGEWSLSANE